jgi:superfamily II DNA/RNA helicase
VQVHEGLSSDAASVPLRLAAIFTHILTQHGAGQALVFCRAKRGANRVGEDLGQRGVRAAVIHGKQESGRTQPGAR